MIARLENSPALPAAIAGLACLAGLFLIAAGLAVPLEAQIAQRRLEGEFEQALAARHAQLGDGRASSARVAVSQASSSPAGIVRHRVQPANQGSGVVARLMVKRLGVRQIVLADNGTHEQIAQGPIMIRGNDTVSRVTVLAAHRDTHFLFVRDLQAKDLIVLQLTTGKTRRYRVVRFQTVLWNRFSIPLVPARRLLALSTCYPFGGTEYGGPWRRIAWAEEVG